MTKREAFIYNFRNSELNTDIDFDMCADRASRLLVALIKSEERFDTLDTIIEGIPSAMIWITGDRRTEI